MTHFAINVFIGLAGGLHRARLGDRGLRPQGLANQAAVAIIRGYARPLGCESGRSSDSRTPLWICSLIVTIIRRATPSFTWPSSWCRTALLRWASSHLVMAPPTLTCAADMRPCGPASECGHGDFRRPPLAADDEGKEGRNRAKVRSSAMAVTTI